MTPAIAVRSAESGDLVALEELVSLVLDLHVRGAPGEFRRPDAPAVRAFLQGLLRDHANQVLVGEVDGRVSGYLWGRLEPRPNGLFTAACTDVHLHHIAVEPSTRRRGVARALIKELQSWARARDATGLQLQVWSFNTSAAGFFTACGFASQEQLCTSPLRDWSVDDRLLTTPMHSTRRSVSTPHRRRSGVAAGATGPVGARQ